jgi:hypothetical protein
MTALKKGKAKITVKAGGKKATLEINGNDRRFCNSTTTSKRAQEFFRPCVVVTV